MKEKDTGLLLSKYIAPGSKIELEAIDRVLQEDGSYQRKKFDSKVVDVIDEDRLEILMPMEQTKLVLLPVNGEYDIPETASQFRFFVQNSNFGIDPDALQRLENVTFGADRRQSRNKRQIPVTEFEQLAQDTRVGSELWESLAAACEDQPVKEHLF